jgi:hypothetical protein
VLDDLYLVAMLCLIEGYAACVLGVDTVGPMLAILTSQDDRRIVPRVVMLESLIVTSVPVVQPHAVPE